MNILKNIYCSVEYLNTKDYIIFKILNYYKNICERNCKTIYQSYSDIIFKDRQQKFPHTSTSALYHNSLWRYLHWF